MPQLLSRLYFTMTDAEITCIECGKVAEGKLEGWAAYGPDGLPLESQLVYCPSCDPDPKTHD
jgi:hypothetical protein